MTAMILNLNLAKENVNYVKSIVKMDKQFTTLPNYLNYCLKRILNGKLTFLNPMANDFKNRNELQKHYQDATELTTKDTYNVKFNLSKDINSGLLSDLDYELKAESYWTLDNLITYLLVQILTNDEQELEIKVDAVTQNIIAEIAAQNQLESLLKA